MPYKGNEEWIDSLEKAGTLTQRDAWRPWFSSSASGSRAPAGYVTTYTGSDTSLDFAFVTIRLAGHMVPTYKPVFALTFLTKFLKGEDF